MDAKSDSRNTESLYTSNEGLELRQTRVRQRIRAVRAFVQAHLHDGGAGVVLLISFAAAAHRSKRVARVLTGESSCGRNEACAA